MLDKVKSNAIWLLQVGAMIGIGHVATQLFFEPSRIPSGSMKNTIKVGDYVIANNMKDTMEEVKRGDIITFYSTPEINEVCSGVRDDKKLLYIKRLIGKPGDKINVIDGIVKINDEILNEDYIDRPNRKVFWDNIIVPPDNMVVFGDNRMESCDSSYFGFVPTSQLKGKTVTIIHVHAPLRKVLSLLYRFEYDNEEVTDNVDTTIVK